MDELLGSSRSRAQQPYVFRAKAFYSGESVFGATTMAIAAGGAKERDEAGAAAGFLAGIASAAGSQPVGAEEGQDDDDEKRGDLWVWPALSGTYRMPGAKEEFGRERERGRGRRPALAE